MTRLAFWLAILKLVPWYRGSRRATPHRNRTIRLVPLNALAFMR